MVGVRGAASELRACLVAVAVCSVVFLWGAPARASSLTYVSGGNVWLSNPDGTGSYQVTLDGSTADPYSSPSQADDGTILAQRGSRDAAKLYRMAQNGSLLVRPFATVAAGSGPIDPLMTRDGTKAVFYFASFTNGCLPPYTCPGASVASAISYADRLTDPTTFKSANGGLLYGERYPSWLTNGRVLLPLGNTVQYFDLATQTFVDWFHFYDYKDLSPDGTGGFTEASASPDGHRLAAVAEPPTSGAPAQISLFTTGGDLATGNPPASPVEIGCVLKPPDGSNGYVNGDPSQGTRFDSLSWAPDGSALAYGYGNDIYVATLTSLTDCSQDPVTKVITGASDPSWGPANVNPGARPCTSNCGPATNGKPTAAPKAAAYRAHCTRRHGRKRCVEPAPLKRHTYRGTTSTRQKLTTGLDTLGRYFVFATKGLDFTCADGASVTEDNIRITAADGVRLSKHGTVATRLTYDPSADSSHEIVYIAAAFDGHHARGAIVGNIQLAGHGVCTSGKVSWTAT
jgi:hypothetical protein